MFSVDSGTLTITGPKTYDIELAGPGAIISWYSGSGANAQAQPWQMEGFLEAWSTTASDIPVTFTVAHQAEMVRGSFTLNQGTTTSITGTLDVEFVRGQAGASTDPLPQFTDGMVHLQFSPEFVAAITPTVETEAKRGACWLYCWLNNTC